MASFKDFLQSQPEREFVFTSRGSGNELTPAPTTPSASSFKAFVAGGAGGAGPLAWNASAHDPALKSEEIAALAMTLIIPPQPRKPDRRAHLSALAGAALYASSTAECAVCELREGTPLSRIATLPGEDGRYRVETPFDAWVDVDLARHRRSEEAPAPASAWAVTKLLAVMRAAAVRAPRDPEPALLEALAADAGLVAALGRGEPALANALHLDERPGRVELAPAWREGYVDITARKLVRFGDGSLVAFRTGGDPEMVLDADPTRFLVGPDAIGLFSEQAGPIEFTTTPGKTRHHPETLRRALRALADGKKPGVAEPARHFDDEEEEDDHEDDDADEGAIEDGDAY